RRSRRRSSAPRWNAACGAWRRAGSRDEGGVHHHAGADRATRLVWRSNHHRSIQSVGGRVMRVLIVGAGIAGPTLAYWLERLGHEPTLVEWAPELRRGGYVVDFWGAGFDVAERMGIVPELRRSGFHLVEARAVGRGGRRIASFEP